jgi:hypothetical protein
MDPFIPYLGKIVRLDVHHQNAFAIAGVVGNKVEKIKKRREKLLSDAKKATDENKQNMQQSENDGDEKHLDVWA